MRGTVVGNSSELRKAADDLEVISNTIADAYREHMRISEDELRALLDGETWISPAAALDYGFATIIAQPNSTNKIAANVRVALMKHVLNGHAEQKPEEVPLANKPLNILNALLGRKEKL